MPQARLRQRLAETVVVCGAATNPQLTGFLLYDYAEARMVATMLLNVSGGPLAGGLPRT
jgi:hypothetical protein